MHFHMPIKYFVWTILIVHEIMLMHFYSNLIDENIFDYGGYTL